MPGDGLRETYKLCVGGPPPMSWEDYRSRVELEWESLLAGEVTEEDVQVFLERHPCLLPGAHAAPGVMRSGHAPFLGAVIAQPPLRGLTTRVPDFIWLGMDSVAFNPVFIEIEAPGKKWATKTGQQSADLTQAIRQLDTWERWLSQPQNRQLFYDSYKIPLEFRGRSWSPSFVLIYGRREENPEAIAELRASWRERARHVIPYDSLRPDEACGDYLCVRLGAKGFVAKNVPPTAYIGPNQAFEWHLVAGKVEAAARSEWMSVERKQFLAKRFPYWDEWSKGSRGLVRVADRE